MKPKVFLTQHAKPDIPQLKSYL